MKEAAEQAGRNLMVGFMKRFSEPYRRARAIASRPGFGPLTAYEARFTFGVYPPRAVYDFLNGFGCHHLDLARFLVGEVAWVFAARVSRADGDSPEWRPSELDIPVAGSAWRDGWKLAEGKEPPQEEAWACVLGFEGGAVGTLQLNCLERLNERVVITGRRSAVFVDSLAYGDGVPRWPRGARAVGAERPAARRCSRPSPPARVCRRGASLRRVRPGWEASRRDDRRRHRSAAHRAGDQAVYEREATGGGRGLAS